MKFIFKESDCLDYYSGKTPAQAAEILNSLNLRYADGILSVTPPEGYKELNFMVTIIDSDYNGAATVLQCILKPDLEDGESGITKYISAHGGVEKVIPWTMPEYSGVQVNATAERMKEDNSGYDYFVTGTSFELVEDDSNNGGDEEEEPVTPEEPNFIYPIGDVLSDALPYTMVGFRGLHDREGFSHVQIIVSEIKDDGTVGGEGHHWASKFYPKNSDTLLTLENITGICEGRDFTNFNVAYYFVQENTDGEYDFVDGYIVGGDTSKTTFCVSAKGLPFISIDTDSENKVFCLDPVLLTVNRVERQEIQFVRVEVGNYIADFEFYPDRNIMEIDVSEYLHTLFAKIDIFECQQLPTSIYVRVYDVARVELQTDLIHFNCVYGKNPDPVLPACKLRVQWLDKYGSLHDENFRIVDNVTDGVSKQKFVSKGIELEEKTGEKSVTLAYVGANAYKKERLKTIVFADHVRAWIGDSWKRVKVANSYKTGKGREKQNFEFTIKYAI